MQHASARARRASPCRPRTIAFGLVALGLAGGALPTSAQDMTNQLEASVRLGMELETEPDTSIAFQDFGSRLRWNGEKRIDDTLVGIGYLEFGFDQDDGVDNTRYAYVGLAGDFGTVTGGKQYRAFYDTVTSVVDVAYVGSCGFEISCARTKGVIKYERALGPGLRVVGSTTLIDEDDGDDFLDEIDVGAIAEVGDISVGGAITISQGTDAALPDDVDPVDRIDLAARGTGTGVALGVSAATELREDLTVSATAQFATDDYLGSDDPGFALTAAAVAERFYGIFSLADFESPGAGDVTPFFGTLGYEYPIDDDSLIYAELQGVETDLPDSDFEIVARAVYVYNFGAVSMAPSRDR